VTHPPPPPPPPARPTPPGQPSTRALVFGVIGAPAIVVVVYLASVMLVRADCAGAAMASRLALVGVAALVSAAATLTAWRSWQRVRHVVPGAGGVPGRNRFLVLLGLAFGGLGCLASLWLLGVLLFLDRCARG
jgi:hypothetical protein